MNKTKVILLRQDYYVKNSGTIILVIFRHYSCPYIPNFPGLQDFTGKVTHSHEYRCPEPYVNQRVLTIGGGPSGIDISLDLSKTADEVCYCILSLQSIAIDYYLIYKE